MRQLATLKKWAQAASLKLDFRRFYVVLLCLTLLCLGILFAIGWYNYPSADDYGFGVETHRVWAETGSFWQMLKANVAQTAAYYQNWQGSFVAIFIMGLQPATFGPAAYRLVPLFTLLPLVLSIAWFSRSFYGCLLKCPKRYVGCISCIQILICTQLLPSAAQGFYWFNGATYYTTFYALLLLMASAVLRFLLPGTGWKKRAHLAAACLLAALLGGSNYVTALWGLLLLAVAMVLAGLQKNRRWKWLLLPLLLLGAALAISAVAPGNAVRQDFFTQRGFIETIFICFRSVARNMIAWLNWPLIAAVLLSLPLLWRMAQKTVYGFRLPGLVSLFSLCLFAAGFAPAQYAMSQDGPYRMQNIYFFTYVILVLFNLFYWCGWVQWQTAGFARNGQPLGKAVTAFLARNALAGLAALVAVMVVGTAFTQLHRTVSSYSALRSLLGGEAAGYYQEMQWRTRQYEDPTLQEVIVPELSYKPYVLFNNDIDYDPAYFANLNIASYYGKQRVLLVPRSVYDAMRGDETIDEMLAILEEVDM